MRAVLTTSPLAYLRAHYTDIAVNRRGDEIEVDGVLRASFNPKAGKWLACDWTAAPGSIGDNIALVQHTEPGTSFPDAVYRLTGAVAPVSTVAEPKVQPIRYPVVPSQTDADVTAGRAYLQRRGIAADTIKAAEAAGMVRYTGNGVLFVGRNAGTVRSVTIRYLQPVQDKKGKPLHKRDFADSSKEFPAILPGDPQRVALVEGGINALAVRDMAVRAGREPPTVIVTGGVGVRRWLENPAVADLLRAAEAVQIVGENERDENGMPDRAKQKRTDDLRDRLAEAVSQVREGEVPEIVKPPKQFGDVADWNAAVLAAPKVDVSDILRRATERTTQRMTRGIAQGMRDASAPQPAASTPAPDDDPNPTAPKPF